MIKSLLKLEPDLDQTGSIVNLSPTCLVLAKLAFSEQHQLASTSQLLKTNYFVFIFTTKV